MRSTVASAGVSSRPENGCSPSGTTVFITAPMPIDRHSASRRRGQAAQSILPPAKHCQLITAPLLGALIGHSSYVLGFAVVAVFPLAAIWITPVAAEHRAVRAQPVRG